MHESPSLDQAGDSFFVSLLVIGAAVVALHVAGLSWLRNTFWGTHLYSFFPLPVLLASTTALAVVLVLVAAQRARAPNGQAGRVGRRPGGAPPTARQAAPAASANVAILRSRWLRPLLIGAGSALVFWLLRIRHLILGDAHTLAQKVASGESFHPNSPLTEVIHQALYRIAGPLFQRPGRTTTDVAMDAIALGSVISGGIFALVAWALAGEMIAARVGAAPRKAADSKMRWLLFLCLMAQGYALLFCGYVENYTYAALCIGLYLLFALRYLEARSALVWPGLFLLMSASFHLMAVILAPSFLVLVFAGLRRAGRRLRVARDLAILAVLAAGLAALLWKLGHGYDVITRILEMGKTARAGEVEEENVALFSLRHLRDFFNEQVLIGPLSLLLAVAALACTVWTRRFRDEKLLVLLVAAGACALVSFMVKDLRLSYPRDWDLFAPFGIAFATFGFYVFASGTRSAHALRWDLALALFVSLFHTAAWVGVNASFERSFERLKTLPLGFGRSEALVGYWYGLKGDYASAHQWLDLSKKLYPNNASTYLMDGYLNMTEGQFLNAAKDFYLATTLRPGFPAYRVWLVDALVRAGHREGALEEATLLADRWPNDPQAQALYGVVLLGAGRKEEARRALSRATELAPGVEMYRLALRNVDEEGGYEKTLHELWHRMSRRE